MTRPPAPAAEPLDPERLFARLRDASGLVLAVSGGPDSTALMALVARWKSRPPVLVVSVDHGLRPEAAEDARLVAENAAKLGLPSRIMRTPERRESGNLQDWGRRARYACLAEAAREAGFDTIVTAHHREDQAETFLLRLARGSGVYGLAAMAEESDFESLRLARPLLRVARARLAEVAAEAGLAVTADPSNEDVRFDRVKLRKLMPVLAEHGLDASRLADTAGRLRRAASAIDHYVGALLKEHFSADSFGVVRGRVAALAEAPDEVGLRALALILTSVGGADYTPPLDPLENVYAAITNAAGEGGFRRTLHGVVLGLEAGRLVAMREWGRKGIVRVPAPAGSTLVWDRRFRVQAPHLPGELGIGPLGDAPRRLRSPSADAAILRTLPGLYIGDTLVAVPEGIAADDGEPTLGVLAAECLVAERLHMSGSAVDHHVAGRSLR
jgi:tRNA(Ile)-lysidine synthase